MIQRKMREFSDDSEKDEEIDDVGDIVNHSLVKAEKSICIEKIYTAI